MNLVIETFAAERRDLLDRMDESLGGVVASGLFRYLRTPNSEWYSGIIREVRRLWDDVYESETGDRPDEAAIARRDAFIDTLNDSLDQTTRPSGSLSDRRVQVDRITRWLSTATVNDATVAAAWTAAGPDDLPLLEWVTMQDSDVRDIHTPLQGQQVPVGETFTVGGYDLHYPGEPVGPPEVWINCRCVVRPTLEGEEMSTETVTTFADTEVEDPEIEETEDDIDPDAPVVEDGIDERVPFHGVLAPLGVLSGDRRRLSGEEGAITWRDGASPVVLRRVKEDNGGHMGAVRIATFDRIWAEDGVIKTEGFLSSTAEGQEAIELLAEGAMGVSIDLDNMVAAYVNEDGSDFDFDLWEPGDAEPVMEVTEGRIAAATIVDIPAFQEAFIALGTWAEADMTASCIPCEAAALVEEMTEEQVAEFERALAAADEEVVLIPDAVVASASERVLDDHFLASITDALIERFAPGTKDGPGWITNPKETQRLRDYWTRGAGAAKIRWGQPGDFNRCRRQLAKYVKNPRYLAGTCANLHKVALGVWPGQEKAQTKEGAIMASAFTLAEPEPGALVAAARPAEWFKNPGLTGPTPLTVEDDGHVYGHVATWDVCHIADPEGKGKCTLAPRSLTDYAYFKTGLVRTSEGDVPVGHITMGTGHAGLRMNHVRAAAHYDNTGAVVADITVGEDQYGIWFSGAIRPNVSDEDVEVLRSAALSGDWRGIRGNREMVAALAVNVPGFPIPRTALAASADEGDYALVAAGVLWAREGLPETFDITAVADAVVDRLERRERTKALRSTLSVEIKAVQDLAAVEAGQRLAAVRAALR